MERLLIGLLVLGLMLGIMVVIAWLAMRESRREYDEHMRWLGERRSGRQRPEPTLLSPQTPDPTPS